MKTNSIFKICITLGLIIPLFFSSCHEEFLEEKVFDFVSPSNFFQTSDHAIAAVNSCYDALQGNEYYGRNFKKLVHFPSDEMRPGSASTSDDQLDNLSWFTDNGFIGGSWNAMYAAINRTNAVLDYIPDVEMNENLKARLLGEARFLRALNYFNLVRCWGDVPLITKVTTSIEGINVARAPKENVYQVIIEDLKFSEINLPVSYSSADKGRVTQGAAKGLLAKVYLTLEEWQLAANKAKEIIDSKTYDLFPNYADAFAKETKNGIEHLFAIQATSGFGDEGTQWSAETIPSNIGISLPATLGADYVGEHEFWEEWDPDDARYDFVWLNEFEKDGVIEKYPETNLLDFPIVKKFLYQGMDVSGLRDYPINKDLLRYADILLIYSEALNEVIGPSEDAYYGVNKVRARANLEPLSGLTKDELRNAILDERKFELCFEFNRWFDLVRRNMVVEVMANRGKTVESFRALFPIPQHERDRNPNLEQNLGYN